MLQLPPEFFEFAVSPLHATDREVMGKAVKQLRREVVGHGHHVGHELSLLHEQLLTSQQIREQICSTMFISW